MALLVMLRRAGTVGSDEVLLQEGETVIGRHDPIFQIDDKRLSRRHASFSVDSTTQQVTLTALGVNSIYILRSGSPIKLSNKADRNNCDVLQNDDVVRLIEADVEYRVEIRNSAPPTPPRTTISPPAALTRINTTPLPSYTSEPLSGRLSAKGGGTMRGNKTLHAQVEERSSGESAPSSARITPQNSSPMTSARSSKKPKRRAMSSLRTSASTRNEACTFAKRCAVFTYDSAGKEWKAEDNGGSNLYVLSYTTAGGRIVALAAGTRAISINTPIHRAIHLQNREEHFVQWRDHKAVYGVSFETEHERTSFVSAVKSVAGLSSSQGPDTDRTGGKSKAQLEKVESALSAWMGGGDTSSSERLTPRSARQSQGGASKRSNRRTSVVNFGNVLSSKGKKPKETEQKEEVKSARQLAQERIMGKISCLRDKKAVEIYTSELAYVSCLEKIVGVCLPGAREAGVDPESIRVLFCNVEVIQNLNRNFLDDLEKRLLNWTDTLVIGDVMLEMLPFFKMYEEYYKNYEQVPATLKTLEKSKKAKAWLSSKSITEVTNGQGLPNLLIQPCQRLVRYALLTVELLKETPMDHPDFENLQKALTRVQGTVSDMNENVRASENQKKLNHILKHPKEFLGFDAIILPHRKLLSDCAVNVFAGDVTFTHLYLFNDIVVFCHLDGPKGNKLRVSKEIPLTLVWYDSLTETGDRLQFQLITPQVTYLVMTKEPDAKDQFLVCLDPILRRVCGNMLSKERGLRVMEFEWPTGDKYKGEWEQGSPGGEGVYTFSQGHVYEGSFKKGKFCGKGVLTYLEKLSSKPCKYEGEWKDSKPDGEGTLLSEGTVYVGLWAEGRKSGEGKLTYSNGDYYEGEFADNLPHGKGVLSRPSCGFLYTGEFDHYAFHGKGVLESHKGVYEGELAHDQKQGEGVMKYTNGDTYKGHWHGDKRQGPGVFTSVDGNTFYEGDWRDDKMHGTGRLVQKGLFTYTGGFKENKFDNNGILICDDGTRYEGRWSDGKKEGMGSQTYANGDTYDGKWHNDRRFGKGRQKQPEGWEYDGEWVNDRFEGKGTLSYPDGAVYSGAWVANRRQGTGVYQLKDMKYSGEWKNDRRHGKGTLEIGEMTYEGMWEDDQFHGEGMLRSRAGKCEYTGQFNSGVLDGAGTYSKNFEPFEFGCLQSFNHAAH